MFQNKIFLNYFPAISKSFKKHPPVVFYRKGVLKNLAKYTGKFLCWSLFFNKLAALSLQHCQKETLAQVLPCDFCEIFKNAFFTEHFGRLLLGFQIVQKCRACYHCFKTCFCIYEKISQIAFMSDYSFKKIKVIRIKQEFSTFTTSILGGSTL